MLSGSGKGRIAGVVLLMVLGAWISAFGGSAVVGTVAGSMNATLGGQALLAHTTIFSGDSLAVQDGAAVVAVGAGSRLVFGRETAAAFLREGGEVTVLLGQGNVSLYQTGEGPGLRVKVGEVSILPAAGFKTLGEVALLQGALVVTAKEGKLRVEGRGPAVEVVKGKTLTLGREARSPQGGAAGSGSGAAHISTATVLQLGSVAVGGTSAVLSGVAMSRAADARDAAEQANRTAADAEKAARDAQAAAQAAQAAAQAAGCATNDLAESLGLSPYELPYTCP